jgi:hypothetical protein
MIRGMILEVDCSPLRAIPQADDEEKRAEEQRRQSDASQSCWDGSATFDPLKPRKNIRTHNKKTRVGWSFLGKDG